MKNIIKFEVLLSFVEVKAEPIQCDVIQTIDH
jgi:hypothetical protein